MDLYLSEIKGIGNNLVVADYSDATQRFTNIIDEANDAEEVYKIGERKLIDTARLAGKPFGVLGQTCSVLTARIGLKTGNVIGGLLMEQAVDVDIQAELIEAATDIVGILVDGKFSGASRGLAARALGLVPKSYRSLLASTIENIAAQATGKLQDQALEEFRDGLNFIVNTLKAD